MSLFKLIEQMMVRLFEAEERRINNVVIDLNQQNKRLRDMKVDGFIYSGQFFMPQGVNTIVTGPGIAKKTLHFSLNDPMEALLRDKKQIKDDRDQVKQTVFKLLKPCQSDRDVRNALPECLVDCVPGLAQHPRLQEPAWTIRHDERAMRQYEKILPQMEVYSAARLIY